MRWILFEDVEGKGIICDWNYFENNYDIKVSLIFIYKCCFLL